VRGDDPGLASYLRIEELELATRFGAPTARLAGRRPAPGVASPAREMRGSHETCGLSVSGCVVLARGREPTHQLRIEELALARPDGAKEID
jgi:hypothetical protein